MTTDVLAFEATPPHLSMRLRSLLAGMKKVSAAHDARRRFMELSDLDVRDAGLSREDAAGVASHQPDVPFFMQPGFGAHRR
jgi:uncharacterized protein YjiS (DUF1127 family)